MKYIVLIFTIALMACNANTPEEKTLAANVVVPGATKIVNSIDTVIPKAKPVINNNRVRISKARMAEEINSVYPFDIDLKTVEGKTINSAAAFKDNGQPTVLLFWLTTCHPCRMELEAISKQFESWAVETNFNFYAISTDFEKNFPNFVSRVAESKWPFQAFNDANREFRQIMPGSLNGLPQVFLLDKNGKIAYHSRKYSSGDELKLYEKIKLAAR